MCVCFNCNQIGHFKGECLLKPAGVIQAPTLAIMRITDGHQGRAEAPRAKRRAFQLTAEEAKHAPDIVASMSLVNSIPTLVLFDS